MVMTELVNFCCAGLLFLLSCCSHLGDSCVGCLGLVGSHSVVPVPVLVLVLVDGVGITLKE